MANIASAGNADTACLQVILEKGYTIQGRSDPEAETTTFVATKGDTVLAAENGMELWERWGEDWQKHGLGKDTWDKIDYPD